MDWLNYHHLFYFWSVVREGGVSKASKVLRLAQPTVSGQIKALENAFGEKLFERQGRSLVLTDVGQVVFRYADEIFSLGQELQDTLKGRPVARPRRLVVGVSDSVEKRVAHRLLVPALEKVDLAELPVCLRTVGIDVDPLRVRGHCAIEVGPIDEQTAPFLFEAIPTDDRAE